VCIAIGDSIRKYEWPINRSPTNISFVGMPLEVMLRRSRTAVLMAYHCQPEAISTVLFSSSVSRLYKLLPKLEGMMCLMFEAVAGAIQIMKLPDALKSFFVENLLFR
jgi:hypothetical protein